jgi:MFS family permease
MNLFNLLTQRRFAPLFWVQFSSAMNNNIFKSGLMVLITFQGFNDSPLSPPELINIAAGLFIFPFFLFSTLAGFLADKYEKSKLIQKIKLLEVTIMVVAGLAFYFHSLPFLLFILFLLGIQAALLGPLKYSILPQHLGVQELVAGNALIEMGTFIAILIGTVLGSAVIYIPHIGIPLTLGILLCSALFSYGISFYIPYAAANAPHLHFSYRAISHLWTTIQIGRRNKAVFLSTLLISWFWLYGAFVLTQLPSYVKLVIGGNARIFTLFLALFSIGIGLGSFLCSQLSRAKIKLFFVPIGAMSMSLFTLGLFLRSPPPPPNRRLTDVNGISTSTQRLAYYALFTGPQYFCRLLYCPAICFHSATK